MPRSLTCLSLPSSLPPSNPSVQSASHTLCVSPSLDGLNALPSNAQNVPVNAVKTGFVEVSGVALGQASLLRLSCCARSGDRQLDDHVMTTVDFTRRRNWSLTQAVLPSSNSLAVGPSVSGVASTITKFNTLQSTLIRFKGSNPLPVSSREGGEG
ncbi:hypothetical protein BC830DRAFT_429540 [Chytriomyces sp. MP71]|nr:hypothetical protein BC830DRAFT_429540 [Chytriomyces sp. MP71]